MSAATSHRLDGLEPDNLLAFLALMGLLRALDLSRPEWQPRAYWDVENAPLRPVLTTRKPVATEDIAKTALEGLQILRMALWPFSWPRTKQGSAARKSLFSDRSRQSALARRCVSALDACRPNTVKRLIWGLRCDLLAISGASRMDPKKGETFDVTPMKLPSGQMTFIGAQFDAISACKAEDIRNSLFETWTYGHKGNSLRFSPDEARRYAYRASDPSPEGSSTELGATALGSLGLLAFTMVEARPNWRMVAYTGRRSEGEICWPIWGAENGAGASLQMIVAMLRALPSDPIRNSTRMIARARRYVLDQNQGDYGNITRAELSFPKESS